MISPCEADLTRFPVLMEILLWIFEGGEGALFFGLVSVPVRVTGVRGGGGGGSSSFASALPAGTVICRWRVDGRWSEDVPHGDPVLKVRTLDMTEGGFSLLLSLPLS